MLIYWLLFFIPAAGVISRYRLTPKAQLFTLSGVCVIFTIIIGLRHEIGADWHSYTDIFNRSESLSFFEILRHGDPGYYILNWASSHVSEKGIYLVNIICGLLTMSGVLVFSRRQPLPWLSILIAVPYLIIVVAMGYTRQSVALGFVLLALVSLGDKNIRVFVFLVVLASAFHKSAVLVMPLAAVLSKKNRALNVCMVLFFTVVVWNLFLSNYTDQFFNTYIASNRYQSEGGIFRVLMNAIPALLFIIFHSRLPMDDHRRHLWLWMSVLAIACVPFVFLYSTATDRVALYLIPVQMFVFSRLHAITKDKLLRAYIVFGVMMGYATVLAVWLFLSNHSYAWLPYRMYDVL